MPHTPTSRSRRRLAILGSAAAVALASAASAQAATVYENDFSLAAGPAFSNQKLSNAVRASGTDQFSGNFGNETQTLTVPALPPHTSVTVSYDLLLLDSWDGNFTAPVGGPDRYTETIGDSTTLDTSFSNNPSNDTPQSFPDAFLAGSHPRYTGAAEHDTILNYAFFGNSVYHFERTVAHTANSLGATFTASGLQELTDESWGIDNVKVTTNGPSPESGMLDSYSPVKNTAPVYTSQQPLLAGLPYTVTVRGTYTSFDAKLMAPDGQRTRGWAICGTPEASNIFASPGTTNGRAGQDAAFLFAFPQQGAKCSKTNTAQLPKRQPALGISTDNGATYPKPAPDANPSAPSGDHTYTYTVTGAGQPLKVKVVDSNYADNSGRFSVDITPQTPAPPIDL